MQLKAQIATLQKMYDDSNDAHLRLMAEFDNYRKRTLREKGRNDKNSWGVNYYQFITTH